MAGDSICVCGHAKQEHEKAPNGALICFHDDAPEDPYSPVCPCMNFEPKEEAEAVGA
jgi:hypothetical protein